jgi:hypothetical protein
MDVALSRTVVPAADGQPQGRQEQVASALRGRRLRARLLQTAPTVPARLGAVALLAFVAYTVVEWWSPRYFRLRPHPVGSDGKLWT